MRGKRVEDCRARWTEETPAVSKLSSKASDGSFRNGVNVVDSRNCWLTYLTYIPIVDFMPSGVV